jgi:hypothetical protein
MRRERALKVVLVLVGLVFSAGVFPVTESLWHQNQSMYTFDMMLSLYIALGIFLLIAARNPSAKSQPDRLHSMVVFRSRGCYDGDVILEGGLSRRHLGRACACHHRCSPDRAGSGKEASREAVGRRLVGSHLRAPCTLDFARII